MFVMLHWLQFFESYISPLLMIQAQNLTAIFMKIIWGDPRSPVLSLRRMSSAIAGPAVKSDVMFAANAGPGVKSCLWTFQTLSLCQMC